VEARVRPGDRKPRHTLGMMNRHVESDDSSIAVADDSRALDLQLTHQLDRVLSHVVVVERPTRSAVRPCPICSGAITRKWDEKNGIHFSGIEPPPPWSSRRGGPSP